MARAEHQAHSIDEKERGNRLPLSPRVHGPGAVPQEERAGDRKLINNITPESVFSDE